MEYFFILGRNPELSKAEILSYLEANKTESKEILFKDNFLILELNEQINLNIQDFGGLIRFGKISFKGNKNELEKYILDEKNEIIPDDKFTYSVIGNVEADDILINKFKQEKRKAVIRRSQKKSIKLQEGDLVPVANADYQIFCVNVDKIYFGLAEESYDYKEIKNRDMQKPIRREELAISPRLAKILINLSQAKPNDLLLDPFCGVGGVLQEALIKGINCFGIDRDEKAIKATEQNLRWIKKNYKINAKYELLCEDSKRAPNKSFDAIATETALGELFRKKPTNFEAKENIKLFETNIIQILRRIKNIKKSDAKLAITLPKIKTFSVNIQRICAETGLKLYRLKDINFPIKEFREDQHVSREICVLV